MKNWAVVGALLAVAGCNSQPEPATYEEQSLGGDPQNGFPNPYERAMFMAANRTRSDPSTVKGPQSKIYPAAAPLALSYDLERSSRFHANMLSKGKAPLMHASPCVLRTDVATSGCDGDPVCGCTTGATCSSCSACPDGTDVGTRLRYFAPQERGWGEIIAAGYGDPWRVMDGWVDEADGDDGHRAIVTSASYGVAGFGHSDSPAGACRPNFDGGDFGGSKPATGRIPSASSKPYAGAAGSYRVYATWADPQGGAPASLNAIVDGSCVAMQRELGDPRLNATYFADVPLVAGCHSVFVLGTSTTGASERYPSSTAFTIRVGGVACAESVAQPAASCGTTPPGDLGSVADLAGPTDLATAPKADLSTTPPADALPTVTQTSPVTGASYAAGAVVHLEAHATDDHGVTGVVASWSRSGVTTIYTLGARGNGVWALDLTLGSAGTRVFHYVATDTAGQTASSPSSNIVVK